MDFFEKLFDGTDFVPRSRCGHWSSGLIALHNGSDAAVWLSYMAIPVILVYFVRRRKDLPFPKIFWMFGGFIVFCGFTHLLDIVMFSHPMYRFSGAVKFVTAGFSVATTVSLIPIIPLVVALRSPKELERVNLKLEAEVAERKKAEEELARKHAALRESERLKDEFFANVSHELRTPLTLILGPAAQLLSSSRLAEKDLEDLRTVERNARILLKHVNDLLDVSKLDKGMLYPSYADVDLAQLVRQTAANFDALAGARGLEYQVEAPDSQTAQVDPDKIERILMNLLSNAFKFTPDQGKVRCGLEVEEPGPGESAVRSAVLTVSDSGPGIPKDQRVAIFERFYQVEGTPTRRFGGTGLGLAIVKEFVHLHGGTVEVTDAAEGGARFRVRVPLHAPKDRAIRSGTRPAPPAEGIAGELQTLAALHAPSVPSPIQEGSDSSRPVVLVVEDNPEMSRYVCEILSKSCRTEQAFDGKEGLERALAIRPDLVLSDSMMPRMSGGEMLREIRARRDLDDVPVVVLTARANDDLRVEVLRSGAQDYILKPFYAEELLARVGNLLTQRSFRREIERQNRELKKGGEDLERANQELEAFSYSVSHDLRAPLRAITGYTRIILDEHASELDGEGRRLFGRVTDGARRMGELIDDLLEFSRTGRAQLSPASVNMKGLARSVLDELMSQQPDRKMEVRLGDLPPARGDLSLLRRVWVNLLDNALKYTGPESSPVVELGGSASDRECTYWVKDNGVGFEMEYAHKLFGVFQRLHSDEEFKGTGVGLALVQRIVHRHGGRVWGEGAVGRGATFYFSLPKEGEGRGGL